MKRLARNGNQREIDKTRFETEDGLPQGWVKTTIADLGFLVTKGSTPTSYGFSYVPSGINFVKVENIYNNHIKTSSITQFITKETHDYLKRSQLHADDVLFSIAGTIGQVAIVHRDDLPANTNQAISIIRDPRKLINTKYLSAILQSKPLDILSKARGVGIYNVSLEDIKNTKIPLPPLPEQYRIVSKIESIFAQIDAVKEHLEALISQAKSATGSLNELRRSILKQAFEGKLVSQDPNDEPAEFLLKRIYKDSATVFEQDDLPTGWVKTTIGNIIEPSKERFDPINNTNRTFIGLEHIESNTGKIIEQGNSKELTSTKTIFRSGDVLYGRLRPYLNKACAPSFDGVCSTDILVFQKQPFLSNKFIALFLITNRFVTYANANMTGVQHPRISFKNIAKFLIFLPPYNEQKRIAAKIESIFAVIDAIEEHVESTLVLADRLKNSTFKSAFEGRLVPQDPDDEPAKILLQKIRQEKEQISPKTKSIRRNKRRVK